MLMDLCLAQGGPEVAGGKLFDLVPAMPGAQALVDLDMTLEEAGVADSMLALKWI